VLDVVTDGQTCLMGTDGAPADLPGHSRRPSPPPPDRLTSTACVRRGCQRSCQSGSSIPTKVAAIASARQASTLKEREGEVAWRHLRPLARRAARSASSSCMITETTIRRRLAVARAPRAAADQHLRRRSGRRSHRPRPVGRFSHRPTQRPAPTRPPRLEGASVTARNTSHVCWRASPPKIGS